MKRIAVYGGSFDPITKGHEWLIEEALSLFDELHVVVAKNSAKSAMFDIPTRIAQVKEVCGHHGDSVFVHALGNVFLVDYASSIGASHLIRGIRSVSDLEAERLIRQVNANINPGIKTLFLHPPKEFEEVSSSMVRSLIGIDQWVGVATKYVSPCVLKALHAFSVGR